MENLKEALNIEKLLREDNYVIPVYQRNYAWGQVEIEQLINDISNAIENNLPRYYIGTLVVFKNEKYFEIIDGQQRHTTLSLIHASIQKKFNSKVTLEKSNLHYEARKESRAFFDEIYTDFGKALKKDNTFTFAINQIIVPQLDKINVLGKLDKWIEYFYESVLFFRVEVPEDTDLHHYFETMNNRGEQLEETEVLKAKFMSQYDSIIEAGEVQKFSDVWDKCSDMFSYYKESEKSGSVPQNENKSISDFVSATKTIIDNESSEYHKLLDTPIDKSQNRTEIKYNSIVNFPNFLLIALKLMKEKISLNEKNLLRDFGYFNTSLNIDSEGFINHLEKCRIIFDTYFVKRNFEDNKPYWVLLNEEKNTFTKDESIIDDEDTNNVTGQVIQDKLVKIQSMLQSAYFSNTNKDWLYDGLKIVLENQDLEITKIGNLLFDVLFQYSKDKFEITINKSENLPEKGGLEIPRITFYFVDYLLWETYYKNIRGNENQNFDNDSLLDRINKSKWDFNKFIFKQNSSIEHYYPQNPEKQEDKLSDSDLGKLHSFGNLCLISRSTNSRFSNFMPSTKKNEKHKSIESLKQATMFSYDVWGVDQIEEHEKEMTELIENAFN